MTQPAASSRLLLLALDTDDMATATSGLCVLPANLQVVVVADTALAASFTETLQVRTVGRGYGIDQNVHVFARFKIIVTIKHPGWNAVGEGVLKDLHESILLGRCELTSAFVNVNVGFLEGNIGKAAPNPLNSDKGTLKYDLALDVCVKHTQEVPVVVGLNDRCHGEFKKTSRHSRRSEFKMVIYNSAASCSDLVGDDFIDLEDHADDLCGQQKLLHFADRKSVV